MIGRKRSVSNTESSPCTTGRTRSRPIPVSMFLRGSSLRVPSASRLYCMKTRFQISTKRASPPCFGPPSSPYDAPRSMKISESGPQGPVSPIVQKLSSSPMRWMRSGRTPTLSIHSCSASSSPSCTVIQRRSPSRPKTSVSSSQAIGIASALK